MNSDPSIAYAIYRKTEVGETESVGAGSTREEVLVAFAQVVVELEKLAADGLIEILERKHDTSSESGFVNLVKFRRLAKLARLASTASVAASSQLDAFI